MKKIRKILSWLLALAMLAAMCPTVLAVEDGVVSPYYGIAEGMIGQIQPGTEESTLLSRLLYTGEATVDGGVKTGSTLNLEDGTSLTLVVQGDCNGDGNFSITDMLLVKAQLLEKAELDTAQALAADYYNIYTVDLDTDSFVEYSSRVGEEEMAITDILIFIFNETSFFIIFLESLKGMFLCTIVMDEILIALYLISVLIIYITTSQFSRE